jgi:hypothetical protein
MKEQQMDDITNKPEFQRILEEAAQYRVLREVVRALDRDKERTNTQWPRREK